MATITFNADTTIAGDLTIGAGDFAKTNSGSNTVKLTFSKTGSQPKITGSGTFQFTNNTTNFGEIFGNATQDVLIDTNITVDWDLGGSGSKVQIGYFESTPVQTTGGNGVTITQTEQVTLSDDYIITFGGGCFCMMFK